jgi:hypothetical protein
LQSFSIAGNRGAGIHQEVAIELFPENESLSEYLYLQLKLWVKLQRFVKLGIEDCHLLECPCIIINFDDGVQATLSA